jgi:F0F1-type ATP synthase assembly protein I
MNGHGNEGRDQPRSQTGEKLDGMNLGMRVLSYLISGVAFYGFLGWLGDHFLGTRFLLPIGIVAGAALGCYVIIRRYGHIEEMPTDPGDPTMISNQAGNAKEGAK